VVITAVISKRMNMLVLPAVMTDVIDKSAGNKHTVAYRVIHTGGHWR
jgi:hypothetical protein